MNLIDIIALMAVFVEYMISGVCNKQFTAFERECCLYAMGGVDPSATITKHNESTSNSTKTSSTSDSSSRN